MNDDDKMEIFNKGVKEGQKHAEPSRRTLEFMNQITTQVEVMKTDMKNIKESLDQHIHDQKEDFNRVEAKLDTFIACAATKKDLDKKAGLWVEKVLWGIGGLVGGAIVLALLDQILRH